MNAELTPRLFRVSVMTGEILEVYDHGCGLIVDARPGPVDIYLSHAKAKAKQPRRGDILVEYPGGHLDVLTPEAFALKVLAGES